MRKIIVRILTGCVVAGCCGLLSCAEIVPILEEIDLSQVSTTLPPVQDSPQENPNYIQVLDKLENLTPGDTIAVRMGTTKEQYDVGEAFEARFAANQNCSAVLMRIAANGTITFLAPSSQFPEFSIQGERVYSTGSLEKSVSGETALYDLGQTLFAGPPSGTETLNLFCSSEPIRLFESDFVKEPVYTIAPDDDDRLLALLDRLDELGQREWAGTSVTVMVGSGPAPVAAPKMKVRQGFSTTPETSLAPAAPAKVPRKFGAVPPIGATGTTGKFFPPIGATGTTGKLFPPIGATGTTGKTKSGNTP